MGILYGYKNKLWKVINEFKYTGEYDPFTLNKGEYLFICNGAKGGRGSKSSHINRGGSSYGIINISTPTTFYAVVGGDGEDSVEEYIVSKGGFNGGGDGGLSSSYNGHIYFSGAGGGGSSDIRVVEPKESVGDNSIYYRIMVAGGGGGGHHATTSGTYMNFTGFGGGVNGGYPFASESTPNNRRYPSQIDGYEFWHGMNGNYNDNTTIGLNAMDGAGGGGGGWYGGYSPETSTSIDFSSANGGGGSGYILTETSHKPDNYMKDFDIEKFYFKDIFMNSGSAEEASVIICQKTDTALSGDKIIFPCVGETTSFDLLKGEYKINCWGGDGGTRYHSDYSSRGGYVEGVFVNPKIQKIYVTVGGSATFASSDMPVSYIQSTLPTLRFNGGGSPSAITGIAQSATSGGGGSDVRIGSDSLYSRIIVAGGAGGMGKINSLGGEGGGETGGNHSSGYGTAPGPGTQTGSPKSNDSRIAGGFGYGGNGVSQNSGHGGAGGGGWYGGSGVVPDSSSDDDKSGAGGSGFIFTENSTVPQDYLLSEEYMMTQPISLLGGNNLPIGMTKIEIDVLKSLTCKMICKDEEGIKYFNDSNKKWEYISKDEPNEDIINEYGTYSFINDDGLMNEYEVYILDTNNSVNTLNIEVLPVKQYIHTTVYTQMFVSKLSVDADIPDSVDLRVKSSRKGVAEDAHIDLTIEIDSFDESISDTKIYCIQAYGTGKSSGYHKIPVKEKTLEHIDLLPVGIGNRMPSRFKSYIGGFIDNNVAIKSTDSAISCERNRNIYSGVLVNDTIVRFSKLNLITNKSTIIKDIPKTSLGNTYYGGMLVDDDYIYLTSSYNNNLHTLWRIPLDPDNNTIDSYQPSSSSDYCFNAFGKMEWYNSHTICISCRKGFVLFDTVKLLWTPKLYTASNAKYDMAVGNKYGLAVYDNNNTSTALVCDIETNTWKDLSSGFKITLSGKTQSCCCYADGKFYITQKNYLHIIDEETMSLDKVVVTPYSSIAPKTINYAMGILYITIVNSQTLYMYDINNDKFQSTSLPFMINDWGTKGLCRPASFRGYFFAPNLRLFTINFIEYAKYNMGYKYDQFIIVMNEEHETEYEYDNRFVTFNDTHINIHSGNITRSLDQFNNTESIKFCKLDKSEYKRLLSSDLLKQNTEEE